jgi:NUMOD3 motif
MTRFYVYTHAKPDGTVFYVGKGNAERIKTIRRKNRHHSAIVKKYGEENIIVSIVECDNEDQAFALEIQLISAFRADGLVLANKTDGGDGLSNPCIETRKKMREAKLGKKHSQETVEKRTKAITGLKRSKETCEKQRQRMLNAGPQTAFTEAGRLASIGRVQSEEEKAKRSASMKLAWEKRKGYTHSDEAKEKMRASQQARTDLGHAWMGRKHTEETRAKMSEKASNRNDEVRKSMSIAAKKRDESLEMRSLRSENGKKGAAARWKKQSQT